MSITRSSNLLKMAEVLRDGDEIVRGLGETLAGFEGARTRLLEARLSLDKAITIIEQLGLDVRLAEIKEERNEA